MSRWITLALIAIIICISLPARNTIDLSEKILKCERMNGLGKQGFGLYDIGDNKYKIFDWNFRQTFEIPISIGEGKAEIKNSRVEAFIWNHLLYIHPECMRNINVYNLKGQFVKDFRMEVKTLHINFFNQKIYLFNDLFFIDNKNNSPEFYRILDNETIKTREIISLKSKFSFPRKFCENPDYLDGTFLFDVDESGNIYLLDPTNLFIYRITKQGSVVAKTKLPYKTEIVYKSAKFAGQDMLVHDITAHYPSFKVINGKYYVLFGKLTSPSKESNDVQRRTLLLKIDQNGIVKERSFNGSLEILDFYNGNLYLYDIMDFLIIPVDINNWR